MNSYDFQIQGMSIDREMAAAKAFPALMRKVYVWMTLAMIITGFTAYAVATTPVLAQAILGNTILFWGLIIGEFALVMGISAGINKLSVGVATLLFILYSIVNGATLSVILFAFEITTIMQTFFITAGTFAAMSIAGFVVKKDLSAIGRFLFMALIGIIIATIVNIFLKSTGLAMLINYGGVLIFAGLTAYDTQKIKKMLMQTAHMGEVGQKMALLGALTLYLDFINLFLFLLRIFGNRD